MALSVDFQLDKIFNEIQREIEEELGTKVDKGTITRVLERVIRSTKDGIERGDTVVWRFFGNFVATQRTVRGRNLQLEREGRKITLIDNGFHRVSLSKTGQVLHEGTFQPKSTKDIL